MRNINCEERGAKIAPQANEESGGYADLLIRRCEFKIPRCGFKILLRGFMILCCGFTILHHKYWKAGHADGGENPRIVISSNGNNIETKAERSFDLGFIFIGEDNSPESIPSVRQASGLPSTSGHNPAVQVHHVPGQCLRTYTSYRNRNKGDYVDARPHLTSHPCHCFDQDGGVKI